MKKIDFLKLIVFLACVTLTLNVTYLVGSIAITKGMTDLVVRQALIITVASMGLISLVVMVFLFIRLNKKMSDEEG